MKKILFNIFIVLIALVLVGCGQSDEKKLKSYLNKISIEEAINFFDETVVEQDSLDFVNYVANNLDKIDSIISASLVNYTIDRLNLVDKAIVRLATSELLAKTDKRIVINEALEITKEFSDQGDHKAASFNNRLLDTISKNL